METLNFLAQGLAVAGTPANLWHCFIGVLVGTAIGVLPGIGPLATVAMLLPLTYALEPGGALIMLAGIYYGSQYGGSTTAILLNLPGEAASAVTTIDGYAMARRGRAGPALATAAIGSFFAGTVATIFVAFFSQWLTSVALLFHAADYFSLILVGLVLSVTLAAGSLLKSCCMVLLGVLVGLTGTDIYSGATRFTYGLPDLFDGIDTVAIAVGLFGISEILRNLEARQAGVTHVTAKVGRLWLDKGDPRRIVVPILRGTGIGSFLGILPGGGALLSSYIAYVAEKRVSPNRAEFGKGAIEGVAAPESANNAAAQTSFIPMLSLGIPSNAVMALMVAALIMHGITPGPTIVTRNPELFWGLVASMWIGNAMLVLLNLPLVGLWVSLLRIPYGILFPAIIGFCCIGAYSINGSMTSVWLVAICGIAGYALIRTGYELTPFLIGFIMGPMLEEYARRALLTSYGDASVFLTRPISAGLIVIGVIAMAVSAMPVIRGQRHKVFTE